MSNNFVKGMQKTPGSGRKKGQPSKMTEEVRKLARQYSREAMVELGRMALKAEDEKARILAIQTILDRAYGKASPLPLDDSGNASALKVVILGDDAKL